MDITPIDILHVQFKQSLKGYNKAEVDGFLRRVASGMEVLAQERAELRDRVGKLETEVRHCQELEKSMHDALILAQKTADELKANAHREAELIIREAEHSRSETASAARQEMAAIGDELRAIKQERTRFEADFRNLVRGCSEWLELQSNGRQSSGETS